MSEYLNQSKKAKLLISPTLIILFNLFTISLLAQNDSIVGRELKVHEKDSVFLIRVKVDVDKKNKPIYKMGMHNTSGVEIVPPIFDYFDRRGTSPVFTVYCNQKIGFYNIKGQELMPVVYDYVDYLTANCWRIRKENKEGVFNLEQQQITIPAQYDKILYKDDGNIPIRTNGGYHTSSIGDRVLLEKTDSIKNNVQLSLVDLNTNKELIAFGKYKDIKYSDKCGFVLASSDSDWEMLDFSGKSYLKGILRGKQAMTITPYGVITCEKDLVGFIPFKGKIIPPQYEDIIFYDNGLATVSERDSKSTEKKSGVINSKGKILVTPQYNEIYIYKEYIKISKLRKEANIFTEGILDINGKTIIPAKDYQSIEYFAKEKVAVVSKEKDDDPIDFGLIDSKGKILVPIKYRRIYHKDGIVRLETHLLKSSNRIIMGMYNIKTKKMLLPKYDGLREFVNGVAVIGYFSKQGNKWGLLDRNGEEIVAPIYETMFYDDNQEYAEVTFDKKHGIIGARGEVLVPLIFDKFTETRLDKNGIIVGKIGTQYAAYDFHKGKEILPLQNYEIMRTRTGLLYWKDGERVEISTEQIRNKF